MVLFGYNQCMNPMATSKKSAMKFSTKESSSQRAPGNETEISSEAFRAISVEAFRKSLYTITSARCVSCHSSTQTPLHASSSVETAHNALIDSSKIDFTNISNSRMVLKLKNDRHNCWGDCNDNAVEILNQITAWKEERERLAPTASDPEAALKGKVTKETDTIADLMNPENMIDQGTVTVMAESGSLRSPMVKASEGTNSYIWAPEGSGIKTLTSADAGLAYISFKLTNSDFYKIWMLVSAPDTSSDSVWVKVGNSENKEWHIGMTNGFEWKEVKHTTSNLDSPFYLPGGTNQGIEIRQREDGLKIAKVTITNEVNFDPRIVKNTKATISLPVNDLSGVNGSVFEIDIEEYDMFSYKLTNPRIKTTTDLFVKNLKVLVNGSYNPQHATYTIVDKKVTAAAPSLSSYSMILLKDKGSEEDRLSFSFEHLGVNEPSQSPAPTPATPESVPPVTKLTSTQAFEQTLWPVLRMRCASCHGASQTPLHSSANVSTAHTAVTENTLVNFNNIPASAISVKLKTNRHNCWGDCNANAAEIESKITIWKNLLQ